MANGTVKWFNTTKGFGFIAPETGGKDVFLHISALERAGMTTLNDDQKVTFDVEAGRDGRESATNIALAGSLQVGAPSGRPIVKRPLAFLNLLPLPNAAVLLPDWHRPNRHYELLIQGDQPDARLYSPKQIRCGT